MSVRAGWMGMLVACVCGAVFVGVLARVGQLQGGADDRLQDVMGSRVGLVSTEPVRGSVFDRRGRVIAATRFGSRVFVDPVTFPSPPGASIVDLADVLGQDPGELGSLIVGWMSSNEAAAELADRDGPVRLRRYVPLTGAVDTGVAERVRGLGIPGVHVEDLPVREYPASDDVASLAGKVGVDHTGLLGIEYAFDSKLRGAPGRGRYARDASRRPLWIEPGTWRAAERGVDVRVSVDLMIQRIAVEELQRGVLEADAAGGRIVVADPSTGEILAIADLVRDVPGVLPYPWWPEGGEGGAVPVARYDTMAADPGRRVHPALARNRCVEDVYEPGSSFKPFVWAALTEAGLVSMDEVFETGASWRTPYGRRIEDTTKRERMTWPEVLENSSNIGMVKGADRMTHGSLREVVLDLGFGTSTRVGLPGEASGLVQSAKDWGKYTQTSVAFGHEIAVTPVQMLRAFCALCRTGDEAGTIPDLSLRAIESGGAGVLRRVFRAETTAVVRGVLERVAAKVEEKMARSGESGWRYSMFGKSGTADISLGRAPEGFRRPAGVEGYFVDQYNSSFVGGAPVENPRLAVIVVIDDPGPERIRTKTHYGSSVAGPVVRRVVERSLGYLRVEPDRATDADGESLHAEAGL